MRISDGLKLRRIGSRYMVVNLSEENVNLSEVFTLNATAAGIWERIESADDGECSEEDLADWLCEEYDIDRQTALADVKTQILEWKKYGLIKK